MAAAGSIADDLRGCGLDGGGGASAAERDGRLTNLSHLDFLGDWVDPPRQEGHTTYHMEEEPVLRVLWTYAEPDASGSYQRIGGGEYDPATNTYSQGAYNTDDMARRRGLRAPLATVRR